MGGNDSLEGKSAPTKLQPKSEPQIGVQVMEAATRSMLLQNLDPHYGILREASGDNIISEIYDGLLAQLAQKSKHVA